jgi:hypothetical protein
MADSKDYVKHRGNHVKELPDMLRYKIDSILPPLPRLGTSQAYLAGNIIPSSRDSIYPSRSSWYSCIE